MGKRLQAVAVTFITCYLFWLLLTMSVAPGELVKGLVICLLAALFSAEFFVDGDACGYINPLRWCKICFYFVTVFFWEVVKANWAMAKTVFSGAPLKQAIVRVPVRGLKTGYELAVLADCITLTPGTITVEVTEGEHDGESFMYIQWINLESKDSEEAGEIIKGNMERWIGRAWK